MGHSQWTPSTVKLSSSSLKSVQLLFNLRADRFGLRKLTSGVRPTVTRRPRRSLKKQHSRGGARCRVLTQETWNPENDDGTRVDVKTFEVETERPVFVRLAWPRISFSMQHVKVKKRDCEKCQR